MKKSKSIIDQYAEVSAAYTEAMQIAHETWVTLNSIKDMMTQAEKRKAIKFLAERAIKRSK